MENIDNFEAYEKTIRLPMSTKQTNKHNAYEMSNYKTTNHMSANWNRYSLHCLVVLFSTIYSPMVAGQTRAMTHQPSSLRSRHFQIWKLAPMKMFSASDKEDARWPLLHYNPFLHLSKMICPLFLLSTGMGDVFTFLMKDLAILNSFHSKKGILK